MYTTPNSIRLEPFIHAKIIALDSVRLNLIIPCYES